MASLDRGDNDVWCGADQNPVDQAGRLRPQSSGELGLGRCVCLRPWTGKLMLAYGDSERT